MKLSKHILIRSSLIFISLLMGSLLKVSYYITSACDNPAFMSAVFVSTITASFIFIIPFISLGSSQIPTCAYIVTVWPSPSFLLRFSLQSHSMFVIFCVVYIFPVLLAFKLFRTLFNHNILFKRLSPWLSWVFLYNSLEVM